MFAPPSVALERRDDGALLLRSTDPLRPYPASVGVLLRRWAHERPGHPFLVERDGDGWRTATYAEIAAASRRVAAGLLAAGLTRETPVAILSEASIAHAIVALAALDAGIPVAPISPAYSTLLTDHRRLRFVLDALRPGLVFAADGTTYGAALRSAAPAPVLTGDELAAFGSDDGAHVDAAHAAIAPGDVAKILFTSGSTGEPKGVVNTHRMLTSNQQSLAQAWPFLAAHDLVLVDWLPWHHTFGGNHNFNMALYHGGTLVIDDGRPLPDRFARSIDALRTHAPTVYFNVPRGHRLLVDALEADEALARHLFSQLRLIGNAAAALPAPTWEALRGFARRYGTHDVAIAGAWGLTETSPMATVVHYAVHHSADIGVPGPGAELLLVPTETKYEVRVRGPLVTPGYWRRDDLTAEAFDADGFYRTGDAVRFVDAQEPSRGLLFDGRLAENFKISSGTWVDAGAVRLAVLAALDGLVDEAIVAGENADEIGVLLVAGDAARRRFGDEAALRNAIAAALDRYNAGAPGSSSRIGRACLLDAPLSFAEGEVTDKGSVNRRRVIERRAADVASLFTEPVPPGVIAAR